MSKITRTAISRKRIKKKKKKKRLIGRICFYASVHIFDSKFQKPIATKISEFFQHLDNRHLMAHQMAQRQYGQKSKIG